MKKILLAFVLLLSFACLFSACNGNQPQKEDVITVEDGYLVVNGKKTEHKVDSPDVIEVIDGYLVVNGVKTEYKVAVCAHVWETVTTAPTCSAGGYDTMTCKLCGKEVITNETAQLSHTYSTTYSFDDNNHWFKCTGCDAKKDEAAHTPDADNNCTVCGTPLAATPGVIYDISADGTYAEVIGYEGTATKVKIASEYKGLPVKNIFDNAFKNNTTITSVIIPEGVVSIGDYAFYNTKLSSVAMPDSLVTIGNYAFYRVELVSVVIPDGVVSIGNYAFAVDPMYYNWSLASVVIGNSVTTIGNNAFNGCRGITSLVIGENVVTIGESAFYNCIGLTSITIPDSVTTIGGSAFSRCSGLTSIAIPDGVTTIGISTFENCTNLQYITLPDSVTNICRNVFSNCHSSVYTEYEYGKYVRVGDNPYAVLIEITNNNLSTYTIHEDTRIIASQVFADCPRLTTLTIPDNVIGLSDFMFVRDMAAIYETNTKDLKTLIIGKGVKKIGRYLLVPGFNLDNLCYTGSEAEWNAIVIDSDNSCIINSTKHYNYVHTP